MAKQQVIVSVLADTKKFSSAMRNLSRETGLSRLAGGFKTLGSRIASTFKTGIKLAAGLAAGIGALSIKGGIARALDTEDATILMKQLGMSTKDVDKALAMVTKTFAGTPFKNPDGFNFSAQLRASGKGLDQIERDLRTTSNITAMTLEKDFGQISELFLKMSANSRVTATDLNSIGLAGYPIRQVLADALDTSVEGLNKMVSAGDLSYDKMMELLSGVKELDGAAESLGDSTRMSWSTMLSWFSIVGEAFVTDILPIFKDGFQSISKWLEDLYDPAKEFGEAVATWIEGVALPAVKRFGRWLRDDLWPIVTNVAGVLREAFATAVDTVKDALDRAGFSAEDAAETFGETLLNAVEKVGDAVAWVVEKLGEFVAWVIDNKDEIANLALLIAGAAAAFAGLEKIITLTKAAMAVFNTVMAANPIALVIIAVALLVGAFVALYNESEEVREAVDKLWEALKEAWERIWPALQPVLEKMGELFEALIPILADLAVEFIENLLPKIERFADEAIPVLEKVADALGWMTNALDTDQWDDDWSWLQKSAKKSGNEIQEGLSIMTMAMQGDFRGLMDKMQRDANEKLPRVQARLSRWGDNIKSITGRATDWIKNKWSTGWNSISSLSTRIFGRIGDSARQKFNSLVDFMRGLPARIRGVFASAGQWLWNAGREIINGLLRGIQSAFGAVQNKLRELTNKLPSWKGPASKDRKILAGPGRLIIAGLVDGLESEYTNVKRSLAGLTRTIAGTGFEPLTAPTVTAGAGRGSGPVEIKVYAMSDGPEVGRRVHEALESFYRVNGVR